MKKLTLYTVLAAVTFAPAWCAPFGESPAAAAETRGVEGLSLGNSLPIQITVGAPIGFAPVRFDASRFLDIGDGIVPRLLQWDSAERGNFSIRDAELKSTALNAYRVDGFDASEGSSGRPQMDAGRKTNDLIDLSNLKPLLEYDEKTWTAAVSFHSHSRFSDGELTPTQLAQKMHDAGVTEAALTDHDNVQGQEEFINAARGLGMTPHTGVELSAGAGVHIVVLDFDIHDATLTALLKRAQQWRLVRAKAYVKYLNALPDFVAKGVTLTIEEVLAKTTNGQIERPQIAEVLVDKGMVADKNEAFKKYIGFDIKDPEVLELEPKPEEVMAAVRSSGGYAFLAHPYTVAKEGPTPEQLLAMGMRGVEAYRPTQDASPEDIGKIKSGMTQYLTWAHDMNLLVMPGADFHGPSTPHLNHPSVAMPAVLAAQLLDALAAKNRAANDRLNRGE